MRPTNELSGFLPSARREGLIRKELEGELLVYDLTRDKAHCLNESAAAARNAKAATSDLDVRRTWILLGDPAMRVR